MQNLGNFGSIYYFCENIIKGLRDIAIEFFYLIQTPLADLMLDSTVFNWLTPWVKALIRVVLDNTPIGDMSIITIMFNTGLIAFVVYAVVKFYTR